MQEFVLLALIMALGLSAYWAMVVFPKQRDFQKRQRYVRTLSAGDEVITYGGIIGRVLEIRADEGIALVEIADGVVVRMITAALMQSYNAEEIAKNAQIGMSHSPTSTPE
jgi:preprotein translocase subunit YajC